LHFHTLVNSICTIFTILPTFCATSPIPLVPTPSLW
jgi:hypothetical protein